MQSCTNSTLALSPDRAQTRSTTQAGHTSILLEQLIQLTPDKPIPIPSEPDSPRRRPRQRAHAVRQAGRPPPALAQRRTARDPRKLIAGG